MTTTDTTALQERIARAIYRSDEDEMDRLSDDFGDLAPHWQRMYLMNAAAVLPIIARVRRVAAREALDGLADEVTHVNWEMDGPSFALRVRRFKNRNYPEETT